MAGEGKPAKAGFIVGALALIGGAVGAWWASGRAAAQEAASSIVGLSKEAMDLLAAIASGVGAIIDKLDEILAAIRGIAPGGAGGAGYPPNTDSWTVQFVPCPVGQPQAYRLSNIEIPDGFSLNLVGRNPTGANAGVVWVSPTQEGAMGNAGNTQAWPVAPNGTLQLFVKNANSVYIGAAVAGEGVYLTVEQRR
jgi:hypothetical protein